ncbi:hypothetical protein ACF05F_33915 [Rhodococcus erythropolis]
MTFVEQVEGLTRRYQRRTPALQRLVEQVGILLAGRGGARLLGLLGASLSRTSVLFHLMHMSLSQVTTPAVPGVDDFALYADVYGTPLVDGDTHLPVPFWEGRDAAPLAAWLRGHPGVSVVCRDGSLTYRQGIADGAPDALQVSDSSTCGRGSRAGSRKSPPRTVPACRPPLPSPPHSNGQALPSRVPQCEATRATRSGCSMPCTHRTGTTVP